MSKRTIIHIVLVLALALATLLLVRLHAAGAETLDPHRIYEDKCARCHQPHAVNLVREHLKLEGGKVLAKEDGREVGQLLASHAKVKLSAAQLGALVKQFDAMLKTGFVFQDRCFNCHGPASVFARTSLKIAEGKVVSKASGREMNEFLKAHGYLSDEAQRQIVVDMLKRQLETR